MKGFVTRPTRTDKKTGKKIKAANYIGIITPEPGRPRIRVPLHRTDKQCAEKRLKEIMREMQQEKDGLIAPQKQRNAQSIDLREHIPSYIHRLEKGRRDARYIYQVEKYLLRIFDECAWSLPGDATKESFERWRDRQTDLSPKTLNEYRSAAVKFFKWMCVGGLLTINPLEHVEPLPTKGIDKRERRSLTIQELARLVAVSGARGPVYAFTGFTGLRRDEVKNLRWKDLYLEQDPPVMQVRASTTKNGKAAVLPLYPEIADMLRSLHKGAAPTDRVFPRLVPEMETMRRDLEKAGIAYVDERGKYADFHALRYTCNMLHANSDTPLRHAQKLMRHSSQDLTARGYIDAGKLDLDEHVNALPSLKAELAKLSALNCAPISVFSCQNVSEFVSRRENPNASQDAGNQSVVRGFPPMSDFVEKGDLAHPSGFEPETF